MYRPPDVTAGAPTPSAARCPKDRQVGPRQTLRQRFPSEPGKLRDFIPRLLSATDNLADVVQAQQPVDALWSTVVFDARPEETLSPNLQSGLLSNFTDRGGFGSFTVRDKPTG
jgi:hypothetical protein